MTRRLPTEDGVQEKILICPYFGDLPPWMDHYWANAERLKEHGYNFLLEDDEEAFRDRVRDKLGIEPPPMWGTGKIWDFRPALGLLYQEEIHGAEFWGHTDFDCVYGRVEQWGSDEFLSGLDIWSNHIDYLCGPWTMYRNDPYINMLFTEVGKWTQKMESVDPTGWAEREFTCFVDLAHSEKLIRRRYTMFQTRNLNDFSQLRLDEDGALWEANEEVMMAHFRRTKVYPQGCIRAAV